MMIGKQEKEAFISNDNSARFISALFDDKNACTVMMKRAISMKPHNKTGPEIQRKYYDKLVIKLQKVHIACMVEINVPSKEEISQKRKIFQFFFKFADRLKIFGRVPITVLIFRCKTSFIVWKSEVGTLLF